MGWVVPKVATFSVTIVAILTLSNSASADPDPETAEDAAESSYDAPLPTSLSSWESGEDLFLTPPAFPQGRLNQKPPLADFGKMSFQGFAGMAAFSSSFDASPTWVAGLGARLPITGISDRVGLWGEFFVSQIHRDLPFYYANRSGTWMGFGVGLDYELFRGEISVLRAQVGALYAYFGDLKAVDDGFGGLLGLQLGFHWIKSSPTALITINPQVVSNGSDLIFLVSVGFEVQF